MVGFIDGNTDTPLKRIIRGFFKPFEILAMVVWQILRYWYLFIIAGLLFLFCFILPNFHSVLVYPDASTLSEADSRYIYFMAEEHRELVPNWVSLGCRNLVILFSGITGLAIIIGSIYGIVWLYKWSHDN